MATWTLHGRRRQDRRSPTDKHGPWPAPEDRLLCIRVDLKQNPTQRLHGRVFGMRQSKAAPWIHVLLPVLRDTLRTWGDAPGRHVETLRARLEVEEPPQALEASPGEAAHATTPPAAPLVVMMAPRDPARAPTT